MKKLKAQQEIIANVKLEREKRQAEEARLEEERLRKAEELRLQ